MPLKSGSNKKPVPQDHPLKPSGFDPKPKPETSEFWGGVRTAAMGPKGTGPTPKNLPRPSSTNPTSPYYEPKKRQDASTEYIGTQLIEKLCAKGKAAAQRKFDVYPSAYANMYASAVCSGKVKPGGKKK